MEDEIQEEAAAAPNSDTPEEAKQDSLVVDETNDQATLSNEPEENQLSDFATQFERETGYKDFTSLKAAHQEQVGMLEEHAIEIENKFQQSQIKFSIVSLASKAVSPEFICQSLAHRASCDEEENVTIEGKPANEFIANFLDANPFLAKAVGGQGSGAPAGANLIEKPKHITRQTFESLSQTERNKFINRGGTVLD